MDKMEEYFRKWIQDSYQELTALFDRGVRERDREAFQEMGRIIGEHAVLGTPEGLRIQGADGISLAFEELARPGRTTIRFELKALWVTPVMRPISTRNANDTVTDVGYAVSEYRLQGESVEMVGGWACVLKHIGGCPIIP